MGGLFALQGKLASRAPWAAVGIVALLTGVFCIGFFVDGGPAGDQVSSFLPPESELAQAQERIAADFASTSTTVSVQLLFRGETHTRAGFQDMLDAVDRIVTDPEIVPWLAEPSSTSVPGLLAVALSASPGELTDAEFAAQIESARQNDALQPLLDAAQGLLAGDLGSSIGAMALIHLDSEGGPEGATESDLNAVQLRMEALLDDHEFDVLEGRSFSGAKLNEESAAAQGTSTSILMGLALAVILVVLVLFFRTTGDVAFSLLGLILTIVWVFGVQGLLGPGGLGLIGADNPLAMMIPVLLIGLTVDYALQIVARYREDLAAGKSSRDAVEEAVRHSGLPLFLAAGTTTIAFLTNLTSSLPPMRDFGVVAGVGVLSGWFVMTTFLPAVRTLIDRSRERRGKPLQMRSMAEAIPGVGAAIGGLSKTIVRAPGWILLAVALVSTASFFGAANISTTFSQTDFLPENTESYEDLVFLDEHFAGGGSPVTILVEGDLTDAKTLRHVVNLEVALRGFDTRPDGMTGDVQNSFMTLAFDWAADSGLPGDKYDPDVLPVLLALDRFFPAADDIQALLDKLEDIDPDGLRRVVALHDDGPDRTIMTIPAVSGDPEATSRLVRDLEGLWDGDQGDFYVTGGDILTNAVTDEMTNSQLQSIILTIVAALVVLVIFFGVTEKRPMLGVIAVLPIGLVVGWVMGSMFVLGISYNVMTALITALTIGVGVDYTIHITHRFLEELRENRGILHAVNESMRTTGGALIGSALTTALGFGVLVFSPLVPMQQFGGLTALTILFSLLAAFIVLPPMLVVWALFGEWRDRQFVQERLAQKGVVPSDHDGAVRVVAQDDGTGLRCPHCDTWCFVPHAVEKMECPRCNRAGRNPRYTRAAG